MRTGNLDIFRISGRASILFGMLAFAATIETAAIARDYPLDSNLVETAVVRNIASSTLSTTSDQIPWPTLYGVHQTATVNAAMSCFGHIGLPPLENVTQYDFWPSVSFESPPGSGINYLWGAGIWVGGIVGIDTLVSIGLDDMYPTGYSSRNRIGTVIPIEYPTRFSLRAECDDTLHEGITYRNDYLGSPYQPMNIAVVHRSHCFDGYPASECIIHDILVTNIGNQTIRQGYVGVSVDADVYCGTNGYSDDLAGSIRDQAIAYIVDNDGDPVGGQYDPSRSPTKALAFKFLRSSFVARDTNFNWWKRSYSYSGVQADHGPTQKSYPPQFGTGVSGSSLGTRNRYRLMCLPEWDYDQVLMSSIRPDDPIWVLPESTLAYWVHRGSDTRFLMSLGPFDLPPDSTISVQFAVFTANGVHTDPFIMDFVDIAPELYPLTLNLSAVVANGTVADSLGELLDDPSLPLTGLKSSPLSGDSALIRWDSWVWNNADSTDIYVSAIPDSAFRHPGVIPIWYRPTEYTLAQRVSATSNRFTLRSLEPGKAYAGNVALRTGSQIGSVSAPSLFRMLNPNYAVLRADSMLLVTSGDTPLIKWHTAGTAQVDHFNIYRFTDTAEVRKLYLPFYSHRKLDIGPVDSVQIDSQLFYYYAVPVFAQVPGDQFEFADPSWSEGHIYVIAAVDSHGTAYPFSDPVSVYRIPPRTKDICVLTNSGSRLNFVSGAYLKSFYDELLTGYDYDIFSYLDSASANGGFYIEDVIDWHNFAAYRLLIIDDGLRDGLLSSRFEDQTAGYRKYLETGGTIVYCGSFLSIGAHRYDITSDPAWFDISDELVTDYFGVDSLFYVGSYYYKSHTSAPYVDSLFGFVRAQPANGAPDIRFNNAQNIFSIDLSPYWPSGTAPSVSTFRPNSRGTVIHTYRSAKPATSINEGQPVGIMTQLAKGQTYTFGFHLWYMEKPSARLLVDWMMNRTATGTSDEPHDVIATAIRLAQNYPNPFNPNTTIEYYVPAGSRVRLEIFNILGQIVRTITDEQRSVGEHKAFWDGRDINGVPVSTGIYLYRLQIGNAVLTRKMLLLK